jgi:hypothetical protein
MPFPKDQTYPAVATNTAWQKKKSVLDKTSATGVGPKLTAAEAAWHAIPFADLDESQNHPATSQAAKASWDKAKTAYTNHVVPAHHKLDEAITLADTLAKGKGLNSASKTALQAIVTALKAADKRLTDMSDLPSMFQVDYNNKVNEEAQAHAHALAQAQAARATLSHVSIKSGSSVLGTAASATRQADGAYWAKNVAWKSPQDGLSFLQKELTLEGTATDHSAFSEKLKLIGIVGDGTMKFK